MVLDKMICNNFFLTKQTFFVKNFISRILLLPNEIIFKWLLNTRRYEGKYYLLTFIHIFYLSGMNFLRVYCNFMELLKGKKFKKTLWLLTYFYIWMPNLESWIYVFVKWVEISRHLFQTCVTKQLLLFFCYWGCLAK